MSWGTIPWGTGGWGSAVVFSVLGAVATSTHTVRITLSFNARAEAPTAPGDALNLATWTVTHASRTFTVLSARTVQGLDTFEVYVLEALASRLVTHTAGSTTLRDSSGALIVGPYSASFLGVVQAPDAARPVVRGFDFANDPASPEHAGGTLRVTAAGDYASMEGVALLKKLIIRRLTTMPGSFFHLSRDEYGLGLQPKSILRVSDLGRLKAQIEREILQEPDVAEAGASLTLDTSGVLVIKLRVKTASSGRLADLEFPVAPSGGA